MPDSETPKRSVIARVFLVLERVLAWSPTPWIALGVFFAETNIPTIGVIAALIFIAHYATSIDQIHKAIANKDQDHA